MPLLFEGRFCVVSTIFLNLERLGATRCRKAGKMVFAIEADRWSPVADMMDSMWRPSGHGYNIQDPTFSLVSLSDLECIPQSSPFPNPSISPHQRA